MKTFIMVTALLSLATSVYATEVRRSRMGDVRDQLKNTPGYIQVQQPQDEGCRYSVNCGPGEVCVIPPRKSKGVCMDERSVVQED